MLYSDLRRIPLFTCAKVCYLLTAFEAEEDMMLKPTQ